MDKARGIKKSSRKGFFEMYRKGKNIRLKDVIIESPSHKGGGTG